MKKNISIVILTLNEEVNIEECIKSAKLISDDIVVLDSFSQDNTAYLAESMGARVYKNKFCGYASQRNYAFSKITYKHDWLFMLDADERLTHELAEELYDVFSRELIDNYSMFRCRRKDFFLNKWLKRSSGYPTWFPRLFKLGCCKVEREINEAYFTDGMIGNLSNHLVHLPFNKGVYEWFEKHNRYSEMEAELIINKANKVKVLNLFSSDSSMRRSAQKAIVYNLPMRPVLVFVIFYFLKLGFLDGRAGFYYCLMKFNYEVMISCKLAEFRNNIR